MKVRPKVNRIVGLTGTPASNGLMDLWAEFRVLDLGKRLGRFITHYRDTYFRPDKRNGMVIYSYKPLPGAEDAIYGQIADMTISMKAVDHLDMPECVMNEVPVSLSESERGKYDAFCRDLVLSLGDGEIDAGNGFQPTGYGWPGPRMRWCTSLLKDSPREKIIRPLREQYELHEYIGLAADEEYRLERIRNKNPGHRHPLVDWGMTEADCLRYCYEHGYDWEGLYEHFRRVSCWCCPLQSLAELRQLYSHFPNLWAKLKDWDRRTWRTFLADYSVEDLEVRFSLENEFIKQGKSITNREFYTALKEKLRRNTDEQENTHPRQSV